MNIGADLVSKAWGELDKAVMNYQGRPVGTVAARQPGEDALNYDQCFTRDFSISAIAFLMRGDSDIVRHFLTVMVELQKKESHFDSFRPGRGLMPASFGVRSQDGRDVLVPDFGEQAIARVAPVDSGLWWLILLRAYIKSTGDLDFARSPEFQHAIGLILELCLASRFDMYPTMLVPDGSYMIDRRMGVHGYPLDIQALFHAGLRASQELLHEDNEYLPAVENRLGHLSRHMRRYYWLDLERLNTIYRFRVEEYGQHIVNTFNIYPDSIPDWIHGWMPSRGGYFAGNLGPGRMDFRYFAQGNLLAIITSLTEEAQAQAIMDLLEERWDDLIGHMPLKLCFPALSGEDWQTTTGADPKNIPWSYHNGGNWPFLLMLLAAASVKTGRQQIAERALEVAAEGLEKSNWAEYFDGRDGRLIGKEARTLQTWTIAGFLDACEILRNPHHVDLLAYEDAAES